MPRISRRPRARLEGPEVQMQKLLEALVNPTRAKRRRKVTRKATRKKARVKVAVPRRKTAARKPTRKLANAARRTTPAKRSSPRTTSKWWRFTLYGDRGARLGRAVGKGSKLEAAKEGSKLARRHGVRRVVMEGPYASMQAAA